MKKIWKIIIIIILIIIYTFIYNLATIPDNIVIFEGEELSLKTAVGINLDSENAYKTVWTSNNLSTKSINKTSIVNLELFNSIKLKSINVDVIPNTTIIPLGNAIGMKLYTKGVMVVGMSEIEKDDSTKIKPFENSQIEEGDSIISVNNNEINNTEDLISQVNKSGGNVLNIKYIKGNIIEETDITPVMSDGKYKIGLWVRDTAAGVGTVTFYEPSTNMFISLGHGIVDIDTGEIVNISKGELVTANIISIIKGEKNSPGEIKGTITNGNTVGEIYKNTELGVYGKIINKQYLNINENNALKVASRDEIEEGKATILCQLDNNPPQEYEIEIEKIYKENNDNNKSMLIKITDKSLLEKTGGIIQGMSGAPVMQNGKFIGAVTNVLVKDPTRGYAIFGDLLIKQMRDAN